MGFDNKLIFLIGQAKSDSYWYLGFAGQSFENLFRHSDLGFVEIQGLTIWGYKWCPYLKFGR